jgi:glyoxylase-like metal-dependent hydrolase (beta-lactamase superfamily II)
MITASNPSPYTLAGTNTYLVGSRGRGVVIDPGPEDPAHVTAILERAAARGWAISLILVSHGHSDHIGGAERLARATGAVARRWGGDVPLRDGELLADHEAQLCVLYTPGHAADHVAFHWPAQGVLFSGDLLLGEGTVQVTPPSGSMAQYLQSLERVAGLDLALIAPGHGPLIHDPGPRIASYRAHRLERERQVLAAVTGGQRTVSDITSALYVGLDPRLRRAAEGTVLAHLEKLTADGRVRRHNDDHFAPIGMRRDES